MNQDEQELALAMKRNRTAFDKARSVNQELTFTYAEKTSKSGSLPLTTPINAHWV